MNIEDLFKPLTLSHGPALKNRLLLSPLTNMQSNVDGTANDNDFSWYKKCASGGFSLTMACAANVQRNGKTFPGQLGIYNDSHLEGLIKIAAAIKSNNSLASIQIQHGGIRSDYSNELVGPSDSLISGARGLTISEIEMLREDFITAAGRAEKAGFNGVEVHAAFGYMLAQFISPLTNRRKDKYGGILENRSRLLFEIIEGIRKTCSKDFHIGLRLNIESRTTVIEEIRDIAAEAMIQEKIDFIEFAPWGKPVGNVGDDLLIDPFLKIFTELPRKNVRLGASGRVLSAQHAVQMLENGCDFVMIGRAAILDSNFVNELISDHNYKSPQLPVRTEYLERQGLSPEFIGYLKQWEGFVE
ncbi:NADH:flavin oxidoreductase [Flavobacterium sp. LS1R49]|uniref:NADH:flavin oxidoreductase n=1 Tax=Flavobacterium shii TaxID=2987687 RepID=A0A9X3C4F9_9FLAO|nr:NADH:flavin oxidoreductase [Flavobacterium shii]MCV9927584.1 NADH:flavin oxidoreductase [Flavobacterium shii]